MVESPPLHISSGELANLTEAIRKGFGVNEEIKEIHECDCGANRKSNFVAISDKESRFGIKNSTTVQDGNDKDRMISELALLLDAPNPCSRHS